ncbi:unnamed protein product [Cyprideis torosa]|uniref:Uncharacterized protein n=1 Tax=Cyprideis torosa TaxID=163714 RepID=A0A7R8WPH9_9CRUS|nr:unnamed protein product [Cyprideis torosa]CAG0900752.1 unnamed protein product [Cyprideis torosa]
MDVILLAFIFFLVILLITILSFLMYCGAFSSVSVKAGKPSFGKMVFCYKFQRGSYSGVGELFTKVTCDFPDKKVMGIYYDDPKKTSPERCRSCIGVILHEERDDKRTTVDDSAILESLCSDALTKGYQVQKFPKVNYAVISTFPYVTKLSIFFAVNKVYPAMAQYIEERGLCAYPFLEIYGDEIEIVAPLSQQEDFFVPEAESESEEDDLPANDDTGSPGTIDIVKATDTRESSDEPSSGESPFEILPGEDLAGDSVDLEE